MQVYHKVDTSYVINQEYRRVSHSVKLIGKRLVRLNFSKVEHFFVKVSCRNGVKSNQWEQHAEEVQHLNWVVERYQEHVYDYSQSRNYREQLVENSTQEKVKNNCTERDVCCTLNVGFNY